MLSCRLSVVGLCRGDRQDAVGIGKSSLCCRFANSDVDSWLELGEDHSHLLSHDEFQSEEVNRDHFLYFGAARRDYSPKSKARGSEVVTLLVHLIEHTTFVDRVTLQTFAGGGDYAKRATNMRLKSRGKCSYTGQSLLGQKRADQQLMPGESATRQALPVEFCDENSWGDGGVQGVVIVLDPTMSKPSRNQQWRVLEECWRHLPREKRECCAIVLTKCDQMREEAMLDNRFNVVEYFSSGGDYRDSGVGAALMDCPSKQAVACGMYIIPVFFTSARDGVGVDVPFLHLAHKVTSLPGQPPAPLKWQRAVTVRQELETKAILAADGFFRRHITSHNQTWNNMMHVPDRAALDLCRAVHGQRVCKSMFKSNLMPLMIKAAGGGGGATSGGGGQKESKDSGKKGAKGKSAAIPAPVLGVIDDDEPITRVRSYTARLARTHPDLQELFKQSPNSLTGTQEQKEIYTPSPRQTSIRLPQVQAMARSQNRIPPRQDSSMSHGEAGVYDRISDLNLPSATDQQGDAIYEAVTASKAFDSLFTKAMDVISAPRKLSSHTSPRHQVQRQATASLEADEEEPSYAAIRRAQCAVSSVSQRSSPETIRQRSTPPQLDSGDDDAAEDSYEIVNPWDFSDFNAKPVDTKCERSREYNAYDALPRRTSFVVAQPIAATSSSRSPEAKRHNLVQSRGSSVGSDRHYRRRAEDGSLLASSSMSTDVQDIHKAYAELPPVREQQPESPFAKGMRHEKQAPEDRISPPPNSAVSLPTMTDPDHSTSRAGNDDSDDNSYEMMDGHPKLPGAGDVAAEISKTENIYTSAPVSLGSKINEVAAPPPQIAAPPPQIATPPPQPRNSKQGETRESEDDMDDDDDDDDDGYMEMDSWKGGLAGAMRPGEAMKQTEKQQENTYVADPSALLALTRKASNLAQLSEVAADGAVPETVVVTSEPLLSPPLPSPPLPLPPPSPSNLPPPSPSNLPPPSPSNLLPPLPPPSPSNLPPPLPPPSPSNLPPPLPSTMQSLTPSPPPPPSPLPPSPPPSSSPRPPSPPPPPLPPLPAAPAVQGESMVDTNLPTSAKYVDLEDILHRKKTQTPAASNQLLEHSEIVFEDEVIDQSEPSASVNAHDATDRYKVAPTRPSLGADPQLGLCKIAPPLCESSSPAETEIVPATRPPVDMGNTGDVTMHQSDADPDYINMSAILQQQTSLAAAQSRSPSPPPRPPKKESTSTGPPALPPKTQQQQQQQQQYAGHSAVATQPPITPRRPPRPSGGGDSADQAAPPLMSNPPGMAVAMGVKRSQTPPLKSKTSLGSDQPVLAEVRWGSSSSSRPGAQASTDSRQRGSSRFTPSAVLPVPLPVTYAQLSISREQGMPGGEIPLQDHPEHHHSARPAGLPDTGGSGWSSRTEALHSARSLGSMTNHSTYDSRPPGLTARSQVDAAGRHQRAEPLHGGRSASSLVNATVYDTRQPALSVLQPQDDAFWQDDVGAGDAIYSTAELADPPSRGGGGGSFVHSTSSTSSTSNNLDVCARRQHYSSSNRANAVSASHLPHVPASGKQVGKESSPFPDHYATVRQSEYKDLPPAPGSAQGTRSSWDNRSATLPSRMRKAPSPASTMDLPYQAQPSSTAQDLTPAYNWKPSHSTEEWAGGLFPDAMVDSFVNTPAAPHLQPNLQQQRCGRSYDELPPQQQRCGRSYDELPPLPGRLTTKPAHHSSLPKLSRGGGDDLQNAMPAEKPQKKISLPPTTIAAAPPRPSPPPTTERWHYGSVAPQTTRQADSVAPQTTRQQPSQAVHSRQADTERSMRSDWSADVSVASASAELTDPDPNDTSASYLELFVSASVASSSTVDEPHPRPRATAGLPGVGYLGCDEVYINQYGHNNAALPRLPPKAAPRRGQQQHHRNHRHDNDGGEEQDGAWSTDSEEYIDLISSRMPVPERRQQRPPPLPSKPTAADAD